MSIDSDTGLLVLLTGGRGADVACLSYFEFIKMGRSLHLHKNELVFATSHTRGSLSTLPMVETKSVALYTSVR
jgi:hypothetical protein